jgi:molybdate transport system regulatory protein
MEKSSPQTHAGFDQGNNGSSQNADPCLDTMQLAQLEASFRQWIDETPRRDVRLARRRILIVFLLIRYTGAKLNEVLAMDPFADIDGQAVCIRDLDAPDRCQRTIAIGEHLSEEIRQALADPDFRDSLGNLFSVDPAFVRRKFYQRAEACGFAKRLGGPEMIRRARAVELVRGNMPLPAVQKLLGQSTPSLTVAHVSFSDEELQRATQLFMDREATRKTSARNTFFGKIVEIQNGDIQARITLLTLGGHRISSIITNESLERLGLRPGRLVTAEVKAPWITLHQGTAPLACSADNRFQGEIVRINAGGVSTEFVARIDDSTELCALASTSGAAALALQAGEAVWVTFNCFAVVLHADD